jgi:TolB protein
MLLRVYRLTDKVGILVLKTSAAAGQWLADGVGGVVSVAGRGIGGILGVVMQILGIILGVFLAIARGIWRILGFIWQGIARLFGLAGVSVGRTARASGNAITSSANASMARRAARDEIDVTFKEDPLRTQNRRLSYMVIALGIVAVSAVLWATNPGRGSGGVPIASSNGDTTNPFFITTGSTPDATNAADTSDSGLPTVIPTATSIPDALRPRGALAYTVRERGQTDIWAVNVGSTTPIRLTNDVTDERDPEWNPDGTRLAYTSRQEGNWELYVYDVATQAASRVTFDLAFQANPSWSPDGLYLAYENYQGQNLDVFAIPIDGSSPPQNITTHPAPDFSPAWSPSGRQIAFVSWRDGNQDIYVIDLDEVTTTNITNTPQVNEDYPAWSPDGRRIAYSASEQGAETVFVKSYLDTAQPVDVVAFGRTPVWSPDGVSLAYAADALDGSRTYLTAITYGEGGAATQVVGLPFGATAPTWSGQLLPPQLVNSGGLPISVEPLFSETRNNQADGILQLLPLGNVQTERPLLSDSVNDSFREMRQRVLDATGDDFFAQLDDAFWLLEDRPEPGEPNANWHRTGRAVSIPRNRILGFPPQIEIVRETIGVDTYWRVFLRVDDNSQSGQLGEPLRQMPWDFLAATEGGDVEAFNQGGRLRRDVPTGYYIDLTQLAADYGWLRQPAGTDWRANVQSRNYWMFVKHENLTWCQAMLEIYLPTQISGFNCEAGQ